MVDIGIGRGNAGGNRHGDIVFQAGVGIRIGLADQCFLIIIVVKKVQQAVVNIFPRHRQFGRSALMRAADYD